MNHEPLPAQGPVDVNVMPHTPGPWHWEADEVKGDPTGRVRYQVTARGKTVTRVYYSSYEGGPTTAPADARLIAAAPDLLEALRDMVSDRECLSAATIAFAKAAIAKATGA